MSGAEKPLSAPDSAVIVVDAVDVIQSHVFRFVRSQLSKFVDDMDAFMSENEVIKKEEGIKDDGICFPTADDFLLLHSSTPDDEDEDSDVPEAVQKRVLRVQLKSALDSFAKTDCKFVISLKDRGHPLHIAFNTENEFHDAFRNHKANVLISSEVLGRAITAVRWALLKEVQWAQEIQNPNTTKNRRFV